MLALDDPETAASLGKLLQLEGATIAATANQDDATRQLGMQPVDFVICDIGDRATNARKLMDRMKADPKLEHARTVAVTAGDRESERRLVQDSGFDAQVSKPIDFQALIQVLRSLLPTLPRK